MRLDFRAPGRSLSLAQLLARALPGESASRRDERVAQTRIGREGRRVRRAKALVEAGERVAVELGAGQAAADPADAVAVAGPRRELLALTLAPLWDRGVLDIEGVALHFSVRKRRGAVAELRIGLADSTAPPPPAGVGARLVARALAAAGLPVLGDALRGGILVEGGLRLCAAGRSAQAWWPGEPVVPGAAGDRPPSLRVSRATARALARGHPWILADRETGDVGRFAPGTRVALEGPRGEALGLACTEGLEPIAARVWAKPASASRGAASVEERVARALERRERLLDPPTGRSATTDAFRLVHGEADGLPGLAVDRLGGLLRALVTGRACDGFRERVIDALVRRLERELGSDPPVVEVLHLHPRARPRGRLESVRVVRGPRPAALDPAAGPDDSRVVVCERGLRFRVEPGLREPARPTPGTGLYLDQRDNRARLAARASRGGRWLNLFAHTGAFSVALLAGGAEQVVSVDLSAAYLRWLDENLALNARAGADAGRHRAIRYDGRRYLSRLPADERFAGIVIDPPTAAAAGRRFWSVSRDLAPLVEQALRRLEPGGTLFVARNDRGRGADVAPVVRECAARASLRLRDLEPAPPGVDFPSLSGFPEGDPFGALIATTDRAGAARGAASRRRARRGASG